MSKKVMNLLLTLPLTCVAIFCLCEFRLSVYGWCFLPSHLFRDLHKVWSCSFARSIVKLHQVRYTTPNKRTYKINMSTQFCEMLYTDSQDMLVLSSAVASCYYNYCTDGSTSPGNCGHPRSFGYIINTLLYMVCSVLYLQPP
jgi:hypothetical protein